MLDWSGRRYAINDEVADEVYWEDLPAALRVSGGPVPGFTAKEMYIRDCFDALFDSMNMLEHYLRTELLEFADVQFPLAYYVRLLNQRLPAATVDAYLNDYGFELASKFLRRYTVGHAQSTNCSSSGRDVGATGADARRST